MDQTGGTSYPPPNLAWAGEISIDLDMASAACPACHLMLVEADNNLLANLAAGVDEAVALGATVVSNSYVNGEFKGEAKYDPDYTHPGVAITVSTGDGGFGTSYPAASPGVVAVGGTSLYPAAGTARGWSETAWSGSGSGCSLYEPKPAWQHDPLCANRAIADTAAVADPLTGVDVYDTWAGGGWSIAGGTSVAAPIVAAAFALAAPSERLLPGASALYASPSSLFNVTQGATADPCDEGYLCEAGPGYNGPTGLGTPDSGIGVPPLATTLAPAAVAGQGTASGAEDAFAVDVMGQLWERPSVDGTWQPWVDQGFPLGTVATSQPTTLSLANGSLGAFVTTENGTLQELRLSDGVWLWGDAGRPPGTAVVGTPAILTGADDQFAVVVRGADGELYEYQPAGATWSKIGAPGGATIVGDPSVALNPVSGYPTVFAVGGAGRLQMAYQQGLYWHWSGVAQPVGAVGAMGGVSVVSNPSLGVEAAFVRIGGSLWQYATAAGKAGGWTWVDLGAPPQGGSATGVPAAVLDGGADQVFVTGGAGHLRSLTDDGSWQWADLGVPGPGAAVRAGSSPTVLETPAGGLGVWVLGDTGHLEEDAYSTADHDWAWVDLSS